MWLVQFNSIEMVKIFVCMGYYFVYLSAIYFLSISVFFYYYHNLFSHLYSCRATTILSNRKDASLGSKKYRILEFENKYFKKWPYFKGTEHLRLAKRVKAPALIRRSLVWTWNDWLCFVLWFIVKIMDFNYPCLRFP